MEEDNLYKNHPQINEFISKLKGLNISDNLIYGLIGVNSILSSYELRKEINESEFYKLQSGGILPENLEEIRNYNVSEDPSNLQLSKLALEKHRNCLVDLLVVSMEGELITEDNIKGIISRLDSEVSKIDPENIKLNGFYTILLFLEEEIINYEDIGREIITGETKLSSLDIY